MRTDRLAGRCVYVAMRNSISGIAFLGLLDAPKLIKAEIERRIRNGESGATAEDVAEEGTRFVCEALATKTIEVPA